MKTIIVASLLAINATATQVTTAWNSHNAVVLHIDGVSTPGQDSGYRISQKGAELWYDVQSDGHLVTLEITTRTLGTSLDAERWNWPAQGAGPYLLGFSIDDPGVNKRADQDGWRFVWSGWPLVDESRLPNVPDATPTLALLGIGLLGFVRWKRLAILGAALIGLNAQAIYIDVTHHDPQWLEFRLADNQWSSPFDGLVVSNHTAEELALGYLRYEAIRRMSPRTFGEIHKLNLSGRIFDDLVDEALEAWKWPQEPNESSSVTRH